MKRNSSKAVKILNTVSKKSKNKAHKNYYKAYNSLSKHQKENLLSRIFIVDASPQIENLDSDLREELFYASQKKHLNLFLII